MVQYAKLLADQGCFLNAYNYLMNDESNDAAIMLMKDRIYNVIDPTIIQQFRLRKPECPFFKPNQQQKQQQNASRKGSHYSEQNNQHNVYKYTNASFVSQQLVPNHPVPQTFFPTTPQQAINKTFTPSSSLSSSQYPQQLLN